MLSYEAPASPVENLIDELDCLNDDLSSPEVAIPAIGYRLFQWITHEKSKQSEFFYPVTIKESLANKK